MDFTNHLQPTEEEPDEEAAGQRRRLPRLGLTSRILLALVLGLAVGVVFHYLVPAGPAFIAAVNLPGGTVEIHMIEGLGTHS